MLTVKVNNTDLNLTQGEVVAISLQANSIESPDTFQSSFTNTFDVVLSRLNKKALGEFFSMGNSGLEYERITGTAITQDGMQIVSNGFAIVEEYNNSVAKLTVYSGVSDFFEELGDVSLQCLKIFRTLDYNVDWNLTEVTNSQSNTSVDGYIWALANYGEVNRGSSVIDVRYQHPSIFAKTIFFGLANPITTQSETTYKFSNDEFYTDSFFERLLIPFNNSDTDSGEFVATKANDAVDGSTPVKVLVNYDDSDNEDVFPTANFNALTVPGAINKSVLVGQVTGSLSVASSQTITLRLYRSDGLTNTIVSTDTITTSVTTPITLRVEHDTFNDTGVNQYFLELFSNIPIGAQLFTFNTTFKTLDYTFGERYPFYRGLPNIEAKEFFRGICLMFGIVPDVDFTTKTITLRKFENFSTDYANEINWSNKIDTSKEILIENKYGSYAQNNFFKFAEDDELQDSEIFDGGFTVNSQIIDIELDWVELPFAVSPEWNITASDVICISIPVYKSQVLEKQFEPRIAYVTYYNASPAPSLDLTDGTSTNSNVDFSVAKFYDESESENLPFFALETLYFDSFIKMIKQMQKITAYFKLNAIDITQLDFFRPYYLSFTYENIQIRGYYILQLIDEYKSGETSKCELIRLNPF